jgi:predicted sugar kinase
MPIKINKILKIIRPMTKSDVGFHSCNSGGFLVEAGTVLRMILRLYVV